MIFFDPAAVTAATFSRNALASWPTVMRPLKSRITMPSCSRCWISWLMSDGHLEADHGFDFLDGNHFDGIPRPADQEGAGRRPAGVGASCQAVILKPTMPSASSMATISMASHGQPSRKAPSGPLLDGC